MEIQAANLTVEDIRKHISLNNVIYAIKEEWIKETRESIQELFIGITNFFIEEIESFTIQGKIHELITRWGNSYIVMHDLRRNAIRRIILLEYYH